jgi:hypothetical protein
LLSVTHVIRRQPGGEAAGSNPLQPAGAHAHPQIAFAVPQEGTEICIRQTILGAELLEAPMLETHQPSREWRRKPQGIAPGTDHLAHPVFPFPCAPAGKVAQLPLVPAKQLVARPEPQPPGPIAAQFPHVGY